MISYVRTKANHLVYIHEQQAQKGEAAVMLSPAFVRGFDYSMALTGFEGTNCLGCAGLIDFGDYAIVWAYLAGEAGEHFVQITRKVKRVLKGYEGKRLVTYVKPGFKQGARWMRVLGFVRKEEREEIAGAIFDVYEKEARG